jgi:hypothetical protein
MVRNFPCNYATTIRANFGFYIPVYDLPLALLETLRRKEEADSGLSQQTTIRPSRDITLEDVASSPSGGGSKTCSLCSLSFHSLDDQKSHIRSDLHRYNLRQKVRGLKPVSDNEFDQLVEGKCRSVRSNSGANRS